MGGAINIAYFEVLNPLGSSGIVTQGSDNAILFYNPVKQILSSNLSYAAIYQTQKNLLQIFIPATTQVIERSRIGSAHIHYPPTGTFTLNANPSSGDIFSITSVNHLTAGADFVIGGTVAITTQNIVNAINALPNLVAVINSDSENVVLVQSDLYNLLLTITYTGSQNIIASGPQGDNTSLAPNQYGPYVYDTAQTFTVSSTGTVLEQSLSGADSRVIQVKNSSQFPDSTGYILLGYGTQNQEGPIPYIGRPSNDTLLISPAYTIKNTFPIGTDVALVYNSPIVLTQDGTDWDFYITDVVSGRIYAQDLIQSVSATGINIVFHILYPNSIGLGKSDTIYDEIAYIYGGDPAANTGLIWPQFEVNQSGGG